MRLTLLFLCAVAVRADFYIDCGRPNNSGDGLTPATAWQTIAYSNTNVNVTAGAVIRLKRGCTFTDASPRAASITYTLYDSADTGTLPIVTSAGVAAFTLGAGDTGIVIEGLDIRRAVSMTGASSVTIRSSIIHSGTGNGMTVAGSTATLHNVLIVRNAGYGVQMTDTGGAPTVNLVNSAVIGNGYGTGTTNGGYGVAISATGTLNRTNSIISGNGRASSSNFLVTTGGVNNDLGGNNLDSMPGFTSDWYTGPSMFVLTIDGDDYANVADYCVALADSFDGQFGVNAIPFSCLLTAVEQIPSGDYTMLQSLPARGVEVGSHSFTHSDITKTTAFTVSTTNTGTNTITVDRTAKTLTLTSSGNPANNVTVDWSAAEKSIGDLKTAVSGKGWTVTNTTLVNDTARLKGLDDQTTTTFPHAATWLMSAYREAEIDDTITWMQSTLGITPVTFAYGGGFNDAGARSHVAASAFTSGRVAGGGSLYMPSISITETVGTSLNTLMAGLTTEDQIRALARHFYVLSLQTGGYMGVFCHTTDPNVTTQKLLWFVDEVRDQGGAWVTQADVAEYIRDGGHSSADGGLTWTKTYTDGSDYRLAKGSALINTGSSSGASTGLDPRSTTDVQFLDRSKFGHDIGPWVRVKRKFVAIN